MIYVGQLARNAEAGCLNLRVSKQSIEFRLLLPCNIVSVLAGNRFVWARRFTLRAVFALDLRFYFRRFTQQFLKRLFSTLSISSYFPVRLL